MNAKELMNKLKRKKIVILPEETLDDILKIKGLKIIREDDTHISDHIRILKINSIIILQERTTKHELSLRKLKSIEEANKVVNDRLETYEKMWDGCGCKVDYYH